MPRANIDAACLKPRAAIAVHRQSATRCPSVVVEVDVHILPVIVTPAGRADRDGHITARNPASAVGGSRSDMRGLAAIPPDAADHGNAVFDEAGFADRLANTVETGHVTVHVEMERERSLEH